MKKLTFTVLEAGKILGIGRNLAYDSVRRGEIRAVRIGKRLVIPRSEIQRLLGEPNSEIEIPVGVEQPGKLVDANVD